MDETTIICWLGLLLLAEEEQEVRGEGYPFLPVSPVSGRHREETFNPRRIKAPSERRPPLVVEVEVTPGRGIMMMMMMKRRT